MEEKKKNESVPKAEAEAKKPGYGRWNRKRYVTFLRKKRRGGKK